MKKEHLRAIIGLTEAVIYYGGCFLIAHTGFNISSYYMASCNLNVICELGHIAPMVIIVALLFVPWAWVNLKVFGKLRKMVL